jgi:hypothetical protein
MEAQTGGQLILNQTFSIIYLSLCHDEEWQGTDISE